MQPATDPTESPSRRRQRLSSSSSSSVANAPKRLKPGDDTSPIMASAKARGKLPDVVDLTAKPSSFQPHSGAKKLVIKNLRSPSHRNAEIEQYYKQTEKELEEALEAIFEDRKPAVPLERLYRGVEDVCRKGNAEKVYRMLMQRVEKHLKGVTLPRISQTARISNIETFETVLAEWKAWNTQTVSRIFV